MTHPPVGFILLPERREPNLSKVKAITEIYDTVVSYVQAARPFLEVTLTRSDSRDGNTDMTALWGQTHAMFAVETGTPEDDSPMTISYHEKVAGQWVERAEVQIHSVQEGLEVFATHIAPVLNYEI